MDFDFDKFKTLLEENHEFPAPYTFKFIMPMEKESDVMNVIGERPLIKKPSKNGKFVSLTYTTTVQSSDEVIQTYKDVGRIPGVMVL